MTDKQNFEKDINVPSKNIEYHNDAKDCELAKSGSCCYCKNFACYQMEEQLKAKEQECEELREAKKNSLCAWKSLEGTLCPEAQEQLDQLKEQLEAYKMEAEEGKEINAELKAERDSYIDKYFLESQKVLKLNKVLKEIKEIAEPYYTLGSKDSPVVQILQKISEVIDE